MIRSMLRSFVLLVLMPVTPLDWAVTQGETAIERDEKTGLLRVESHSDSEVIARSSEIDVTGDTVYRVDLRAAAGPAHDCKSTRLRVLAVNGTASPPGSPSQSMEPGTPTRCQTKTSSMDPIEHYVLEVHPS